MTTRERGSHARFQHEHDLGGWVLRGGVALFFVLMGAEKFPSGSGSPWVVMFDQIGFGQWFRYFTGAVEIGGALLYVVPRTCPIGAMLLSCAMLGAMAVHIVIRHSVAASLYPAVVLLAIVAVAIRRPDTPPRAITRRLDSHR
ncbi:MAG: DoxX family protein [Gemmatimonadaceae bacterium]